MERQKNFGMRNIRTLPKDSKHSASSYVPLVRLPSTSSAKTKAQSKTVILDNLTCRQKKGLQLLQSLFVKDH
jgi:hypothetical protein